MNNSSYAKHFKMFSNSKLFKEIKVEIKRLKNYRKPQKKKVKSEVQNIIWLLCKNSHENIRRWRRKRGEPEDYYIEDDEEEEEAVEELRQKMLAKIRKQRMQIAKDPQVKKTPIILSLPDEEFKTLGQYQQQQLVDNYDQDVQFSISEYDAMEYGSHYFLSDDKEDEIHILSEESPEIEVIEHKNDGSEELVSEDEIQFLRENKKEYPEIEVIEDGLDEIQVLSDRSEIRVINIKRGNPSWKRKRMHP